MIRINALTGNGGEGLARVDVTVDPEDIASLPKMVRISRTGRACINFHANGVNGGVNETGAKRVRALLRAADKNGIGVVFDQDAYVLDALNARHWAFGVRPLTRADLETLIG